MRKILLSFILYISALFADDHTIAVLDFSGEGIHTDELKSLSEQFRIELLKMDTLRVLDYSDMLSLLGDYGYDSKPCFTIECGVISSMLLEQEWAVSAHIAKIGDAFVSEGRLIESKTGRVINAVTYDHELSIEGLKNRGMHNLAELVMSKRIPIEVHQRQNLVYIKTKPTGALVRVGRDTLNGNTPMALDRVILESRPVILLKEGFEPYKINQMPEDDSDIIYIELQHLVPQIGHLSFSDPVPNGIMIVSLDNDDRFLIDEGATLFRDLGAGNYFLESADYIVINNKFNIKHRRTTQIKPVYHEKSEVRLKRDRYKRNRNIMIGMLGTSLAYRTYLYFQTENIYNKYSSSIEDGDNRHKKIEMLDKNKPTVDILSGIIIFPVVYYHAKYLQMDRWLKQ
tara:strand:+ start:1599 stop:2795 length:1197 start_codon:yes stop_codon:yes gene_type:complete